MLLKHHSLSKQFFLFLRVAIKQQKILKFNHPKEQAEPEWKSKKCIHLETVKA